MKMLGRLLAALLLSQVSWADQNPLPETYQEPDFFYRFVLSNIVDVGKNLEKLGIKAYACRLETGSTSVSHKGIGPCIYEAADYTFKTKQSTTISLWVLNSQGQYLPPVKLEWKNTQSGWISFVSEFLFLAGDKNKKTRPIPRYQPAAPVEDCTEAHPVNHDLGNFIGDLVITFPPGRKVSEYFVITELDALDVQKIEINAKMPFYLNRKRTYKVSGKLTNRDSETIEISVLTNFNLISHRDYCADGTLKTVGKLPLRLVKP